MMRYLHLALAPRVCPEERQREGVREHRCWEFQPCKLSTSLNSGPEVQGLNPQGRVTPQCAAIGGGEGH